MRRSGNLWARLGLTLLRSLLVLECTVWVSSLNPLMMAEVKSTSSLLSLPMVTPIILRVSTTLRSCRLMVRRVLSTVSQPALASSPRDSGGGRSTSGRRMSCEGSSPPLAHRTSAQQWLPSSNRKTYRSMFICEHEL